jgi:hypothetical protein
MFKCGYFSLRAGDAVDFKRLRVPCQELVAISLLESDDLYNDGKTILVPCSTGESSFDFQITPQDDHKKVV